MESSAMMAMRRTTSCGVMELTARCTDAGDCAASTTGTPAATRTEASLNTMRSSTRMGDYDGGNRKTNAPGRTVVRPGASGGSAGSAAAAAQLRLRLVLRGRIAPRLRPRGSAAGLIARCRPRLGARRVVARRRTRLGTRRVVTWRRAGLRTCFAPAVLAGAIDPRALQPVRPVTPAVVAGAADRGPLGRRNDAPAAQIGTAHAAALVVVDRALPFTAQESAVVPTGPVPEDEAGLGTQRTCEDHPGATVVAV